MNLYNLHKDPKSLHKHDQRHQVVPSLIKQMLRDGEEPSQQQVAVIIKSPELAYWYALYIIEGRFVAGEKAIASSSYYATHYASNIIKGRFPEGEKAIAKDIRDARTYVTATNSRFPEAEKLFTKNSSDALFYAMKIKQRFPEGEKAIATDAHASLMYAKNVIGDRWPPGEKAITSTDGVLRKHSRSLSPYVDFLNSKGYDGVKMFYGVD